MNRLSLIPLISVLLIPSSTAADDCKKADTYVVMYPVMCLKYRMYQQDMITCYDQQDKRVYDLVIPGAPL